ncbi:MAG: hypothetical protein AAGG08_05635 [Actinomycetota bacterium]
MLTELERLIEYRRHVGRLDPIELQPLPIPEVRLTVQEQVVPQAAPEHLADAVVWIDERNDWFLRRLDVAAIDAYLTWRATWESSFSLGSVSSLRELARTIRRLEIPASPDGEAVLSQLVSGGTRGGARIDRSQLVAFRSLMSEVADRLRTVGTIGVGLVESSPTIRRTGLLRSWPAEIAEGELASRGTVTVRFSGGRLGVWFADDRDPIEDVREFEFGIDGARVVDAMGVEHVHDRDATDALNAVAPEATAWRVRAVPEVLVWANLLQSLEALGECMKRHGRPAVIHLGDVRHEALSVAH